MIFPQGERAIVGGVDVGAPVHVIGQLHDVVEEG